MKPENTAAAAQAEDPHTQNPADAQPEDVKAEHTADASKAETPGDEKKKELSETEVLKLYLQQALGEVKRLNGELEKTKKEAADAQDKMEQVQGKLGSVVAEYENYRRRSAAEKEELYGKAVAKAVSALLPAKDSLERAVDFAATNPESFEQGVEMTLRQLNDGFKNLGVDEIEAQGVPFDPERHNAVMHVEDETLGDSVVVDVFQKGYSIGERVIRHAVVKVAN